VGDLPDFFERAASDERLNFDWDDCHELTTIARMLRHATEAML
jgi:hypothetical protein